jgi:hypothetical protein
MGSRAATTLTGTSRTCTIVVSTSTRRTDNVRAEVCPEREEVWVPGTVSLLPAPDCHIRGMLSSWVEPRSAARAMRNLAPAGTLLAARQATGR